MTAIYLWDVARWFLLCLIAANAGGCFAVIYFYSRRSDVEAGWAKWLPKHVWRVVAGALLLILADLVWAVDRLGHPPLWYGLPVVTVANALILWGLIYMIGYQRNRLQVARRPPGLKRLDDPPPEAVGMRSTTDVPDAPSRRVRSPS